MWWGYWLQCCQNILYLKYYTLFWQSSRIILYTFFQSNTLKILYYRIKLSKRIKSSWFILFSLNIWYMSAFCRPMSISKKNLLTPLALAQPIRIFFKPCYSKFMIFHTQKLGFGEVFIWKPYFIYTLFRWKSYFIWRKIILYLEIYQWQHCGWHYIILQRLLLKLNFLHTDSDIVFSYLIVISEWESS